MALAKLEAEKATAARAEAKKAALVKLEAEEAAAIAVLGVPFRRIVWQSQRGRQPTRMVSFHLMRLPGDSPQRHHQL